MSSKIVTLLTAVALGWSATYAAPGMLEVVDPSGAPVADTAIVAVIDGAKVELGQSSTGTFEIDVQPGNAMKLLSVTTTTIADSCSGNA